MDIFRRCRQYDPISLIALTAAGIAGGVATKQFGDVQRREKNAAQNVSTLASAQNQPTVDPVSTGVSSNAKNAGRAALISTSPSGVLGTDPTGRRKLLGN